VELETKFDARQGEVSSMIQMTIHLRSMHDVVVVMVMAARFYHQHHQYYYPFLPRHEQQSDVKCQCVALW
jgi:hypothetical protein